MKRISGLTAVPPGLTRFHADPKAEKTWAGFGNFENGAARRELTGALARQQHGLCAYCEIDVIPLDTRVDHVVPQSDPSDGRRLSCDPANLVAVCHGGSNRAIFGREGPSHDSVRYTPPTNRNLSCDAARGNRPATHFIDPRTLPAVPSVLRVTRTGTVEPDSAACAYHSRPPETVATHIDCLKLNVRRLTIARAAIFDALLATAARVPATDIRRYMEQQASARLLPNAKGSLPRFFTTSRSFFGAFAEAMLARPPQSWI